jgi:hypothetical protein
MNVLSGYNTGLVSRALLTARVDTLQVTLGLGHPDEREGKGYR